MTDTLPRNPGFQVEDNVTELPRAQAANRGVQILLLALKALSQRAVIALAALSSVMLAGSVFALYWLVLPNPSVNQLIGLAMYALFILALHLVMQRK